jgi:hypothetical protein
MGGAEKNIDAKRLPLGARERHQATPEGSPACGRETPSRLPSCLRASGRVKIDRSRYRRSRKTKG